VDVLTSRDALVQAELNYAQAKYDYLNDIVSLRLAAGTLDQTVIEQINSWLVEPARPAASGGS
jgi:outer membrane protein